MLEPLLLAIPVALFVALALTFWRVLRRAARVVAGTRENDAFRQAAGDLVGRIALSLAGAAERIDAARRGQVDPQSIGETLAAANEAIDRYGDEAMALATPAAYRVIRDGLVEELRRAGRALDMVEHGCARMAGLLGRPNEPEGHTALKRGYLSLLHSREAILDLGVDIRAARPPARGRHWFSDRFSD